MRKKMPLKTAPIINGKPLPGFISGEIELEVTITTHFDDNGITEEEMTHAQIVEGSAVVLDDPLLLQEGKHWEPIKPSQEDIEWMELREREQEKMINAFKVSPELLGLDKMMGQVQNIQAISETE